LAFVNWSALAKSDFTGSAAYRIHNIGVGMQLLNGLLIAPGEEFFLQQEHRADQRSQRVRRRRSNYSEPDATGVWRRHLPGLNDHVPRCFLGWLADYRAMGDTRSISAGTTSMRSVRAAMVPGLDATIFTGGPDLKFINDTGAWLLIQAWSNPKTGVAQIELYGTKPNRTVDLTHKVYDHTPAPSEPVFVADPKVPRGTIKHTDKARGGMTIDVYRLVVENGAPRPPELFRTRFSPVA
jgi:hypothetical protein